jgi:dihydrofolate reductase
MTICESDRRGPSFSFCALRGFDELRKRRVCEAVFAFGARMLSLNGAKHPNGKGIARNGMGFSDKCDSTPGRPPGGSMSEMVPLTLVAAVARNGALGRDNSIPWRAPSDLKRFRDITWGRPLIMGRKTYQSIGKPLPGRETVVVTRDPSFLAGGRPDHVHVAGDLDQALEIASGLALSMHAAEAILAGGAELYRLGLSRAAYLRLTRVDCAPEADAFFPEVDWSQWREVWRERPERGPKDEVALEYIDYRHI